MSYHSIYSTVSRYLNFYENYVRSLWNSMSPHEYGILLISIAVVGWFFLKSTNK